MNDQEADSMLRKSRGAHFYSFFLSGPQGGVRGLDYIAALPDAVSIKVFSLWR